MLYLSVSAIRLALTEGVGVGVAVGSKSRSNLPRVCRNLREKKRQASKPRGHMAPPWGLSTLGAPKALLQKKQEQQQQKREI